MDFPNISAPAPSTTMITRDSSPTSSRRTVPPVEERTDTIPSSPLRNRTEHLDDMVTYPTTPPPPASHMQVMLSPPLLLPRRRSSFLRTSLLSIEAALSILDEEDALDDGLFLGEQGWGSSSSSKSVEKKPLGCSLLECGVVHLAPHPKRLFADFTEHKSKKRKRIGQEDISSKEQNEEQRPICPLSHDSSCCICLNEFAPQESVARSRRCNHILHKSCFEAWLSSTSTFARCPVCRQDVSTKPTMISLMPRVSLPSASLMDVILSRPAMQPPTSAQSLILPTVSLEEEEPALPNDGGGGDAVGDNNESTC